MPLEGEFREASLFMGWAQHRGRSKSDDAKRGRATNVGLRSKGTVLIYFFINVAFCQFLLFTKGVTSFECTVKRGHIFWRYGR